MLSPQSLSNKS